MENPVIKILQSIFSEKSIVNFKKNINKKTISIGIITIFLLTVISFLSWPILTDYEENREIIEKKINTNFKIDAKIKGNISYKLLPSPRLEIEKVNLNFDDSKEKVFLERAYILFPIFNIKNIKNIKFQKLLIYNEKIKIYPRSFKSYFKYFTILKKNNIILKDCFIFFLDDQKNQVVFTDFTLKEVFSNNKHKINSETNFSGKKVKLKFVNNINGEKKLDIETPSIDSSLGVIFEPSSNLKEASGKSQIKLSDSILTLNFKMDDKFKIYQSFLRNKFLNSKISGEISYLENFFFDLNLDINQVNLRKFLLYYLSTDKDYRLFQSGISKKINGKFEIFSKDMNSFFGRINNTKMSLIFENGDIKIEKGSAILPFDSKIDFSLLLSGSQKEPFLDFSLNFKSNKTDKFLRKFNIYKFDEKKTSLFLDAKIDLINNKIKFKNFVKDNSEKFDRTDILELEKNFNEFVLDEGIFGITNFFKIKKFTQETIGQ